MSEWVIAWVSEWVSWRATTKILSQISNSNASFFSRNSVFSQISSCCPHPFCTGRNGPEAVRSYIYYTVKAKAYCTGTVLTLYSKSAWDHKIQNRDYNMTMNLTLISDRSANSLRRLSARGVPPMLSPVIHLYPSPDYCGIKLFIIHIRIIGHIFQGLLSYCHVFWTMAAERSARSN